MSDGKKFLGSPLTGAYQPAVYGWGYLQSLFTGQLPMFLLGEVEAMRADPQIQMAMAILRSPLHQLKWQVKAREPRVAKFVDAQFGKIWRTSMRKMMAYLEYGNAAAEVLYKREDGAIVFDCLRDVYPRDALPLVRKGAMVGVQVKGNAYPAAQTPTPGTVNLFPPRAFWVAHRARHGNFWGYSRYQGAWWPWLEKRGRHGATDVRRMWFIKNAFRGMRIRHPPGMLEKPDGSLMSCQDYAREIVEKAETGGVLALPNAKDPNSGEYLWVIEDAIINGDLSGVREYTKDLDGEMLTGFEIPPEVAAAAEVGAGWSGRSVPFMVFLTGEDEIVAELVTAIVQWILTPLVEVNFGAGQAFAVEPVSLVELLQQPQQQPDVQTPPETSTAAKSPDGWTRRTGKRGGSYLENSSGDRRYVQMSLEQERDSAARVLDGILDRGTQAGLVAADEIRRKIRVLVKKKMPFAQTLKAARRILASYEPILASTFSDTLLASWLAGAHRVVSGLPELPSAEQQGTPWYEAAGLSPALGAGSEEPPPPFVRAAGGVGDAEPVVHFPIIEEAARDLAKRRILKRADFDALADDAKTMAFTAARVGSDNALTALQDALTFNVAEGQTLREFVQAVDEALGEGESGLAPGHIENIYRTNGAQAYTTGLLETLNHPLVSDEFPYLAYHAVHDARTRPDHLHMETLGLDGTNVYRRDDPIWQRFSPPWDYQCRCAIVPLSVEDAARAGVREAQQWLRRGEAPATPQWVEAPPFAPPPGWGTRPAVRMGLDDEGHEHAPAGSGKGGQFTAKGGGGGAAKGHDKGKDEGSKSKAATPAAVTKEVRTGIKGLIHNFLRRSSVETRKAERTIAAKIGKSRWNKLPPKLQKSIAFAHAASQKILYAIDTPLRLGLNLAKTVARERGFDEKHVEKVARVVNAIDQLSTLPVVGVYTHAAKLLSPALGPISGYVPFAALSYVAYSSARDPYATIRAARKLAGNWRAAVTTKLSLEVDDDAVAALFAAYQRHEGDDWFDALLHAGLDATRDLGEAVRWAEKAAEDKSKGSLRFSFEDWLGYKGQRGEREGMSALRNDKTGEVIWADDPRYAELRERLKGREGKNPSEEAKEHAAHQARHAELRSRARQGLEEAQVAGRITEEQRGQYEQQLHRLLDRLTPRALQLAHAGLQRFHWYGNAEEVRRVFAETPGRDPNVRRAEAFYNARRREVHLDGGTSGGYAEEIAHAIDSRHSPWLSRSRKWQEMWNDERWNLPRELRGFRPEEWFGTLASIYLDHPQGWRDMQAIVPRMARFVEEALT